MQKLFLSSALLILFSIGCKKANDNAETIIKGSTTIVVDESILPIVEDEVAVFENKYNAKITLVPQSEAECINSLRSGKVSIAILTRKLSEIEAKVFRQKKIQPRETAFATDGIALIRNKNTTDSLLALSSVIDFLKQKPSTIKGLVFDNPNSSTVTYFKNLAQLNAMPTKNVFSFNTNNQVIKYVAENDGMVGIIGLNWLMQPTAEVESLIGKITILKIKDNSKQNYYYPTQDNIAGQDYPLARDLYIVNCQGGEGLGMGFASFLAGQIGQRIVLKSGLVPKIMPGRNVRVQN